MIKPPTCPRHRDLYTTLDGRFQWRRVGPYIQNGADPDFATVPSWDQAGKLTDVVTTHGAVPVGNWSPVNDEPFAPNLFLVPPGANSTGAVGKTVSAVDTTVHDGWDRVTLVRHMTNGERARRTNGIARQALRLLGSAAYPEHVHAAQRHLQGISVRHRGTGWNLKRAAGALGIARGTLYRRLRAAGLVRAAARVECLAC